MLAQSDLTFAIANLLELLINLAPFVAVSILIGLGLLQWGKIKGMSVREQRVIFLGSVFICWPLMALAVAASPGSDDKHGGVPFGRIKCPKCGEHHSVLSIDCWSCRNTPIEPK